MNIYNVATTPFRFAFEVGNILSGSVSSTRGFLKSTRAMIEIVLPRVFVESTGYLKSIGSQIGFADDSMKFFETLGSWRKIGDYSRLTKAELYATVSGLYYNVAVVAKIGSKNFQMFTLSPSTSLRFAVTTLFFDVTLAGMQAVESVQKLYQVYQKGGQELREINEHIVKWKAPKDGVMLKAKQDPRYKNLTDDIIIAKHLEKWANRRGNFYKKEVYHLINVLFQVTITAMYILKAGPEVFGFTRQTAADISNVIVAVLGYSMLGLKAWVNMNPAPERRYHHITDPALRKNIFTWDKART